MKKTENIVESVNYISEADLLVRELDKRLSFDILMASAADTDKGCPIKEQPNPICTCLTKEILGCTCKGYTPDPAATGLRG